MFSKMHSSKSLGRFEARVVNQHQHFDDWQENRKQEDYFYMRDLGNKHWQTNNLLPVCIYAYISVSCIQFK